MRSGAGRTPLIIAGVAAFVTYAAFGEQTPFAFLHNIHFLNRHHAEAKSHQTDAAEAAADAAEATAEAAEARAGAAEARADARSADSNKPESDMRSVASFDGIVIEDDAEATITIGDTQSVSVSASDGRGQQIITSVQDGKLLVSGRGPEARLHVTVPHLRTLQVNGAGKVALDGLRDPISIKTNGPVHLSASGAVESADLTLNGPSKLLLTKLETKNMKILLNGVGDAEVFATQNLTAEVHGIGRVRYLGDPHTVSTIHGLGSVERLSGSSAG